MSRAAAALAALGLLLAAIPAAARTVVHRGDAPPRPVLDGTAELHDTADGRFRIHYTLDGGDALTALAGDEAPANGVPDAVDRVATGLGVMWEVYVEQEGWRAPGGDGDAGGDDRLDVYLRHLDYNGYAHAEWHEDHWAAYLEVEPEVAEMGDEVLTSVAAHELHHAIEYAYTVEPHTWVHESSATYAQYRLFHESAAMVAALQLLWGLRLDAPEAGLDATGDRMEYAALLWVKYLVDRAGDPDVARVWWDLLAEDADWAASLDALAAELGDVDGLALFEEYAEWQFFSCAGDDGLHWADDGLGCQLEIGARVEAEEEGLPAQWSLDGPAHFGARYATVAVDHEIPVTVVCDGPSDGLWSLRAVTIADGVAVARRSARSDRAGTAAVAAPDLAGADELLVIVANGDAAEGAPLECEARDFPVEEPEDDGCRCAAADRPRGAVTGLLAALAAVAGARISARRRRR